MYLERLNGAKIREQSSGVNFGLVYKQSPSIAQKLVNYALELIKAIPLPNTLKVIHLYEMLTNANLDINNLRNCGVAERPLSGVTFPGPVSVLRVRRLQRLYSYSGRVPETHPLANEPPPFNPKS